MRRFEKLFMAVTVAAVLMLSFSCAKKQVKDDTMAGQPQQREAEVVEVEEEAVLEESDIDTQAFQEISERDAELKAIFQDIRFDYDDFSLRPEAKDILKGIAEWLLKNTSSQILIEGHCDERGTNEYNLALGERRANSAKKYIVQLGVAPKRISNISYGEEKPLDSTQDEEAWSKNRRDHFLIR